MDSDRESERLFSLRLSRVMGDIGVNSWMIARRRRTHQWIETLSNVAYVLKDENGTYYIFGSQSEATTTPGMDSDTDYLYCDNSEHVALSWTDWQYGKPNLLALKDELTPPQVCYLQRLRSDCPLSVVHPKSLDDVLDGEGRVLLTNTRVEIQDYVQRLSESGEIFRHGPSMTHDKKQDNIRAYHCERLPVECQFMFHRPRPGHWPRPDILARARETGVFLVPQGYTEGPNNKSACRSTTFMVPPKLTSYPYSKWQWRFSTSLMERFLMFDFSLAQIKTYTITKIIRKTVFKPVFEDRFSTFHIKTAMMFTIENYPAKIWREDNIVKCVCLVLKTLKRWVKQKHCPHFTISGVNLFVGKLNSWELPKLCSIISTIINTKLQCLFYIHMDNISLRLLQCSDHENVSLRNVSTRTQTCIDVLQKLNFGELFVTTIQLALLKTDNLVDKIASHLFILQSMSNNQSDLKQEVVSVLTPLLCSTLASILASRCIYLGQPITLDVFIWYQLSLDSDLMSSRLKFASMLYCRGQYEVAAEVLTYCEGLLGPEVCQCCTHYERKSLIPSTEYKDKLTILSTAEVLKKQTMMCITFTKNEIHCIPQHLQFEMIRCIGVDLTTPEQWWKKNVVTDCIPFLYYLQHLTYMELNRHMRALTALHNLHQYTIGTEHGHIDTVFNMLGHCYELQNRLDLAWMCYNKSLAIYDRENAATWHAANILLRVLKKKEIIIQLLEY